MENQTGNLIDFLKEIGSMSPSNWTLVAGWFATFVFGTISGLILRGVSQERKVIGWSVINESNILTTEAFAGINASVRLIINDKEETSVSIVKARISNKGNKEIESIRLWFEFGQDAIVYVGDFSNDLGVYKDCFKLKIDGKKAILDIDYVNKASFFDVDFLVGKYEIGKVYVDMKMPGVKLVKIKSQFLELEQLNWAEILGLAVKAVIRI